MKIIGNAFFPPSATVFSLSGSLRESLGRRGKPRCILSKGPFSASVGPGFLLMCSLGSLRMSSLKGQGRKGKF